MLRSGGVRFWEDVKKWGHPLKNFQPQTRAKPILMTALKALLWQYGFHAYFSLDLHQMISKYADF